MDPIPHERLAFGDALERMREGFCVSRDAWSHGRSVYLEEHIHVVLPGGVFARHERTYEPVFCMYQGSGDKHYPGWTPTAADMLARDWRVQPVSG